MGKNFVLLIFAFFFGCETTSSPPEQVNDSGKVDKSSSEIVSTSIDISVLLKFAREDNLSKESLLKTLQNINSSWKLNGIDKSQVVYSKTETGNEMLTWYYKQHIIEYLIFNRRQFLSLVAEIKVQGFKLTKSTQNQHGGELDTYATEQFVIMVEEIPLTNPGESGYKFLVGEKR